MESLQARIKYQFRDTSLLKEALTHGSSRFDNNKALKDNQRLEFLGDAVLQIIMSDLLFRQFPHFDEGQLTKLRTRLVSTGALAKMAQDLSLGSFIIMGKGEESNGGRARSSILADTMESLVGSIFLDGGFDAAHSVVSSLITREMEALKARPTEINPKGELQEILQGISNEAPVYQITDTEGPDHLKQFKAIVLWRGSALGEGKGARKKEAEIQAASDALNNPILKGLIKNPIIKL
jgi:ribonuclease-3